MATTTQRPAPHFSCARAYRDWMNSRLGLTVDDIDAFFETPAAIEVIEDTAAELATNDEA